MILSLFAANCRSSRHNGKRLLSNDQVRGEIVHRVVFEWIFASCGDFAQPLAQIHCHPIAWFFLCFRCNGEKKSESLWEVMSMKVRPVERFGSAPKIFRSSWSLSFQLPWRSALMVRCLMHLCNCWHQSCLFHCLVILFHLLCSLGNMWFVH